LTKVSNKIDVGDFFVKIFAKIVVRANLFLVFERKRYLCAKETTK